MDNISWGQILIHNEELTHNAVLWEQVLVLNTRNNHFLSHSPYTVSMQTLCYSYTNTLLTLYAYDT